MNLKNKHIKYMKERNDNENPFNYIHVTLMCIAKVSSAIRKLFLYKIEI